MIIVILATHVKLLWLYKPWNWQHYILKVIVQTRWPFDLWKSKVHSLNVRRRQTKSSFLSWAEKWFPKARLTKLNVENAWDRIFYKTCESHTWQMVVIAMPEITQWNTSAALINLRKTTQSPCTFNRSQISSKDTDILCFSPHKHV